MLLLAKLNLDYSGFIEVNEVNVASEFSALITGGHTVSRFFMLGFFGVPFRVRVFRYGLAITDLAMTGFVMSGFL
ncbi:hypothetical protein [Plesiomonas shigelloides]|uniref:hypothetical protein n=1 Tax=Plesiomonas shigelloides TaxID=703 RepID=UPI0022466FB9|nr:hypothetical protein [Plesiomonas shigelloides]MCX2498179.1 hypothetical protein [Plesiomonas shigelloides]